jgi:hypothetical protein
MGPFVMSFFVMGPFVMGPLVMGPFVGVSMWTTGRIKVLSGVLAIPI